MTDQLDTLLSEKRRFPTTVEFAARSAATVALYTAGENWERFWETQARELEWSTPWTQVLDWRPPHAKWFVGGKLNASVNCLDRHVRGPRRNKAAIIWEGEPGDRRVLTYWELAREVGRCANALKRLGIKRGDRVAIYLPMVPEAAVAMLACARIGAVHSVVFGGFAAPELAKRIADAKPKVVLSASCGLVPGHAVPYKPLLDQALQLAHAENTPCLILQRAQLKTELTPGRDTD
jgi:acyl-coenzyme A synthetase/AMP-(fatty) acid ligase